MRQTADSRLPSRVPAAARRRAANAIALALANENARDNLGDVPRTINMPTEGLGTRSMAPIKVARVTAWIDRAIRFVVPFVAVAAAACGGPAGGAALLKESIESIGNEMMSLHEPKRGVEYHDRSGKPFRVAFVPARADQQSLTSAGLDAGQLARCRESRQTVVAVGEAGRTDCAPVPQLTVPELRVLDKPAGEPVRMTLTLDARGYRLDDAR